MRDAHSSISITPLTISLGYILLASFWILVSDWLVVNVSLSVLSPAVVQPIKGLLFVFVTGTFLYILMKKHENKFVNKNREIEALSREVHHRVKNNLALITSLLELERENREFNSEYEELLVHTNFKIRTISVIHDLLYQQNAYSRIDLDRFLKEFNEQVVNSMGKDELVSIDLQFDNKRQIKVDIKYAVPIALFLYECIIFTTRSQGSTVSRLFIDVYKTEANLYLSCHFRTDREVPTIDLEHPDLLELQLAKTLLKQLKSYYKIEYDESEAVIYIDIPLDQSE